MNVLRALWGFVRWLMGTALLILVLALLTRGAIEYVPVLGNLALPRALLRWGDPLLMQLAALAHVPWDHKVRGLLVPGLGLGLLGGRMLLEDALDAALSRIVRKPAFPQGVPAPMAPAPAAATPAAQGAATVLNSGERGAVQSTTGTAFLPSQGTASQEATVLSRPLRIGRYEVIEEIGRGAMGVVYKAMDPRIGRTVAVKTISAGGATGADLEHYRARFVVEAKSAGRLNHPGIVSVYDVCDDEQGRPCLVLEFIEGTPLDRIAGKQALPLPQALDLIVQVARALDYAHAHGIVHRDIKPANVMVTAAGKAKLSDFGIAKMEGTTMTVAGQILGTPAFMSPEQCSTGRVDNRSDIFSLGAVLYTLCTGSKPFPGDTFTTVAYKVVHEIQKPALEVRSDLPPELDRILSRCLAKNPDERYPTAAALADDLDGLRRSHATAAAA